MTVWFDVEDLLHHRREGHARVSGIQRLTLEIYRAAHALGGVGFVRRGQGDRTLIPIAWDVLDRLLQDAPAPHPLKPRLPDVIGPPRAASVWQRVAIAAALQADALKHAGAFAVGVGVHASRSGARRATGGRLGAPATPDAGSFDAQARPGDTLLVLGSPWFRGDYGGLARWLRDERRMRFGVLVHDLVPVRRPEWCDDGLRRVFRPWYADVLPFCDLVLANSRYTAADVEHLAGEMRLVLPRPVRAVPIGSGFSQSDAPGANRHAAQGHPGEYVLFVSTIEARKNHALVLEVWRRLSREAAAGLRAAPPDLVLAGKVGWLVDDLVAQLDATGWLGGRIRHVPSPTDEALRDLYAGAMFTVFPSLFEGWGLPVTESLAFGVPCLCSDAASLPEAGGDLCRYFDPENVGAAYQAVAALLDDRPGLEAWRERVRQDFRPTPWSDTARAVLDEANAA